jgi:hypothetical protein
MTVGQLEASMTMRELVDWRRFEAFHQPLPDQLADIHAAMLAATVTNIARAIFAVDAPPVSAADFFVLRERAAPAPTPVLSEVDRQRRAWRGG